MGYPFIKHGGILIPLIVIVLLLSGCGGDQHQYTIAVSQCSEDIWREKLNEELKTTSYIYDNVNLLFSTARDNDRASAGANRQFHQPWCRPAHYLS